MSGTSLRNEVYSVPLKWIHIYLYAEIDLTLHTFYTKRQQRNLLCQLVHPSAAYLYLLLKSARNGSITPESLSDLKRYELNVHFVREFFNLSHLIRIPLGSETTSFNTRVYLDIMHFDGILELYWVEESTNIRATQLLDGVPCVRICMSILLW